MNGCVDERVYRELCCEVASIDGSAGGVRGDARPARQ